MMENRTDLNLGEIVFILIIYYILDSFIEWLRYLFLMAQH